MEKVSPFRLNVKTGTILCFVIIDSAALFLYIFHRTAVIHPTPQPEAFMNRILVTFFLLLPSILVSQSPSVQLKLREKSGFLGLGDAQSLTILLSNRGREVPLTDVNVNNDSLYIFLVRPAGKWELDEDFIEEDLPGIRILQGGLTHPVVWHGALSAGDSSLMIGFSRSLLLHEPFLITFTEKSYADTARVIVPQELWPGFSVFRGTVGQVNGAFSERRYKDAIRLTEQILETNAFRIFPSAAEFRNHRTTIFRAFFDEHWKAATTALSDASMNLKTKIAKLDEERPAFVFVQDSLRHAGLQITEADSGVSPLLEESTRALAWAALQRDSLQQALDDQNVRWILEGSVAGRNGFLYQTVLEALAYAFSSVEFSDTSATTLRCTIPEDMLAGLAKNNLTDSYETFIRLTNQRFQRGEGLFPPEFLANVRRDTASFRMPVSSMLNAVQAYFSQDYATARMEIFRIFRISYDPEVSARFDDMRIMIQVREGWYPPEAVRLLEEAEQLEVQDPQIAGELFRRAGAMAPNFAYASFALGKYYARQGDAIRAQPFFVRAYESDTLYLSAYRESFNLYRRAGNYKPMIEVLTKALAKGNDYWETQSNLGLAYMGDGDPARAIQHFERALAINPQSYTTNIQLGLAYQTVKNYQKAREYFNNAINIDPLRQEAVEYLTRLNELQRTGK